MEQVHRCHAMGTSELRTMGKRGLEWDLNDWKWDGDLFIATPNNCQGQQQFIPVVPAPGNSSNSSSSCSDDVQYGTEDGRRDLERKRRVIVVEEESLEEAGPLTLKLGGNGFPVQERDKEGCDWDGASGKKAKLGGGSTCRAACQVEGCGADLSKAKDYHRRHKVCEVHSKATTALVANVMQRFCQQCSRFHALQEFDEGKRSCRRRLAGHNKRRRKTQPDNTVNGNPINDDQTNGVLLMSLLRILSSVHANNKSDQTTNQDLVAQLLSSLANPSGGLHMGKGLSGLLNESQKLLNGGMSNNGHSEKLSTFLSNDNRLPPKVPSPDPENSRKRLYTANSRGGDMQAVSSQEPGSFFPIKDSPPAYSDSTAGRMKLNNFDLNDVYVDSDDGTEDLERSPENGNFATGSVNFPSWAQQNSQQSSPPQTSGNSDSASAQSPSSSSGEAQSRTDRIVFKLFGKEPSDFPLVLRGQILDWLAHSPTDIESYIRPGCIILTIYLRLTESLWEELCSDLSSCLSRLFDISDDTFWRTGWVYVRVQNKIAFVHNGQVVLDTSLSPQNSNCSRILSVMPIAVSMDERARFEVRGCNLSRSTTSLLCALEGKYIDQEAAQESNDDDDDGDLPEEDDETEHANLSCSIPYISGRGYIEVEDHGLSSSFFPFIVAEKDVCSEIRTLENVLELKKNDEDSYEINGISETRRQAMEFINEMGWLLHRSNLKSRLADQDPNAVIFSFRRFKWLMDFSMDHDWIAVVKKLVDILVAGTVGSGEHSSLKVALSELGLLHRAVRRNSKSMVEQLLRYVPVNVSEEFISFADGSHEKFLFQPDAQGPAGLTPLHIAAGKDGSEDVLNALIDDPGKVGINAWKNAQDSTGATPEDYARLRGHYSYIHAVQRKFNQISASGHVVVDIPGEPSVAPKYDGAVSFEVGRSASFALSQSCKTCDQKKVSAYYGRSITRTALVYRPAMLSMVAIAAVCVCVALLFKSTPNVVCLFQPFRWELVNFGSS